MENLNSKMQKIKIVSKEEKKKVSKKIFNHNSFPFIFHIRPETKLKGLCGMMKAESMRMLFVTPLNNISDIPL